MMKALCGFHSQMIVPNFHSLVLLDMLEMIVNAFIMRCLRLREFQARDLLMEITQRTSWSSVLSSSNGIAVLAHAKIV